jgi:hypothetical protein
VECSEQLGIGMKRNIETNSPTNEDYIEKFIQYLEEAGEPTPLRHLRNILVHEEGMALESQVRSILRKIRGDPRFVFTGATRDRHVQLNNNLDERRTALSNADSLAREFVKHTTVTGSFELPIEHMATEEMHAGCRVLISAGIVEWSEAGIIRWSRKGFFGFEPFSKRSTALSLPHRTWDSVRDIQTIFDEIKYNPPTTGLEETPILSLALSNGKQFNKSEIVEIALEMLRSQLYKITQ